jgi:acyl-CoA thioester hydrolase
VPRIKLEIPEKILASISVAVRITDINYGNHVGNDAFVAIIHEARVQWLAKNNFTELDIEGIGIIMSELAVEFKNESFYGDTIEVKISIGETTRVGFELYYQLFTERENKSILLTNAKTGMVCYNYTEKKVATLPTSLKQLLEN